jgi:hypothetical protein
MGKAKSLPLMTLITLIGTEKPPWAIANSASISRIENPIRQGHQC